MNLNYSGIKLEDYSEDVRKKYSFPNPDQLERFMRQEQEIGSEQHQAALNLAKLNFTYIAASFSVGTLGYIFYNLPAGKVIRDRIRANMSLPKRLIVQTVPFLGFATAFYLARSSIENHHAYRQ